MNPHTHTAIYIIICVMGVGLYIADEQGWIKTASDYLSKLS